MNYTDWTTALAGYLPENLANAASQMPFVSGSRYNAVLPRCIEYAELRIYRHPDLDFLATRASATATCAIGVRGVVKPSNLIVVEEANIILPPVGAQNVNLVQPPTGDVPDGAGTTRAPLTRTSTAFINTAYPAQGFQQQPGYYAQVDDGDFILGATPDQAYVIEFYGTQRPTALSYINPTTFLTLYLPDLFLAASMIWMSGYQKTFGAMSGDPQQGMTWEQYYGELKRGAATEEARKKFRIYSPPMPVAPPAAPQS